MNNRPPRIMVVGPFMHRQGHFAIFPSDLARGFSENGADVTLVHPYTAAINPASPGIFDVICLENEFGKFNRLLTLFWNIFQKQPILLCLIWIIFNVRRETYDLIYWSDFKSDNQQSTWPVGLAYLVGLYRHRTAFTEHHNFSWDKHRWQRLFRLDRIRLRRIEMFVHSRKLLDWIRLNMNWADKGHYIPWGLWPNPANDDDRKSARHSLGISNDARVLLIFGLQAIRRKEIDTLAEAVRSLTLDRPLVLLFAGMKVRDEPHPFDKPELIQKANLQIHHHESFIPEQAVKSFFAAADAVWAYYGSFIGASGVLAQAIAFGRLSISSDTGESGELCRQYHIGLLAPTGDLAGVQAALSTFMSMSATEQASFEAATRDAAHELAWSNITRQIMDITLTAQGPNKVSTS